MKNKVSAKIQAERDKIDPEKDGKECSKCSCLKKYKYFDLGKQKGGRNGICNECVNRGRLAKRELEKPVTIEPIADLPPINVVQLSPKLGRPVTNHRVTTKSSQEGLNGNETRATFIVDEGVLSDIKHYAYMERLTIKETINKILRDFLSDQNNLNRAI